MEENNVGSDSDTNPEEDSLDYYQPISAIDADSDEDDNEEEEEEHQRHGLSNGHRTLREAEQRISSIGLNGGTDQKSESEEDDELETESETPESSIITAFREDERRRRSPLSAENAARVMDAMRGVSFPGTAPDWVSEIPEDRWIDHLRRLRSSIQN